MASHPHALETLLINYFYVTNNDNVAVLEKISV